jgi:hypothetical protein
MSLVVRNSLLSNIQKETHMSDWRQKANEAEAEKQRKKDEKEAAKRESKRIDSLPWNAPEQLARKYASDAERRRKEEDEHQRNLKRHVNRFKCAICGKASQIPGSKTVSRTGYNTQTEDDYTYDEIQVDWSSPGDLFKCSNLFCRKWVCSEHYGGGYCMNCAKKKFGG